MESIQIGDSKLFQGFFQNLTVTVKLVIHPSPPLTEKQENAPPREENEGYFVNYQEEDSGRPKFRKGRKKVGLKPSKLNTEAQP